MKKTFNKKQKGQAMVETAITLPLLVMLLMAVGYFGSMITTMHNLSAAARYAARAVAMDSSAKVTDRIAGTYFLSLTSGKIKEFAMQSLPGFDPSRLEVQPLNAEQIALLTISATKGSFLVIPESKGFAFVYKITDKAHIDSYDIKGKPVRKLSSYEVGIGNIFFGVRLRYHLKEIDWFSKYLFQREGVKVEAVSLMPAELPLANPTSIGLDYGIMDINRGIFNILRTNVTNKSEADRDEYLNLID